MMSPLPARSPTKPGSCTKPLPGVVPAIVDDSWQAGCRQDRAAWLCIAEPWPGMLRGIWGDDERYREQYWTKVPGKYLTGDNCRRDDDGYYWIMGRIDDVINVSGHRLSTIEVESALVSPSARRRSCGRRPAGRNQGPSRSPFSSRSRRRSRASDLRKRAEDSMCARKSAHWPLPDDIRFTDCAAQDPQRQDHAPAVTRHRRAAKPKLSQERQHAGRLQHPRKTPRRRGIVSLFAARRKPSGVFVSGTAQAVRCFC